MAEHLPPPDEAPRNPNPDYEDRDIQHRAVVQFGIYIFAMVILAAFAMLALIRSYGRMTADARQPRTARALERQLPPLPRLQVDEAADLRHYRAAQEATLQGYVWRDRSAGILRIPIEVAMEQVVEQFHRPPAPEPTEPPEPPAPAPAAPAPVPAVRPETPVPTPAPAEAEPPSEPEPPAPPPFRPPLEA